MKKKLVLFGTGELAEVLLTYFQDFSEFEVAACTVHERYIIESEMLGVPVVAFESLEKSYPPAQFQMFVATGYGEVNKVRARLCAECKAKGYTLVSYIDRRASVAKGVRIGENCFVFENNVIQPFVSVGDNVIIWSGNHIGHHATIGNHVFIASHAVISGGVSIGDYCFLGVNCTLRDHITIGASSVIGAGALIMHDAAPESVFVTEATKLAKVPSSRIKL